VQTHQPGAIVVKQQYTEQNAWHFENRWSSKLCACKPCGRCKREKKEMLFSATRSIFID